MSSVPPFSDPSAQMPQCGPGMGDRTPPSCAENEVLGERAMPRWRSHLTSKRQADGQDRHRQDSMLAAARVKSQRTTRGQEIWKVAAELGHLKADHRKLLDRVRTAEEEVINLGTQHRSQETQIAHLTDRVQRLEYRAQQRPHSGATGRGRGH
ncbi:hypothetical protein NDU88_002699 [Pleurodeles waltl]|uniref:Uncharacterized protein n=1 Tax=Pleurodeles waltl TaxID=8319 RepID=A0AAV7UY43_PLEWA|nr:hypothetical protein NDU88_002699 [Pleurodeles waltl]